MTQLPEPNFIERDADKITREWVELYEQKTGKTLHPAQIERLMIDVGAYRENILRLQFQETAKQNLLSYAPYEVLEHIGEPLGVKKLEAQAAKTILCFEIETPLDYDFLIPKGVQVETGNSLFTFETTATAHISKGSLSVEAEAFCTISSANSNGYKAGSISNLVTALDVKAVFNTVESYGGADVESLESLRERIRQAPESFSNAGSEGAYKFHTFSAHQSIIDVSVLSPSPGVVEIYPLLNSGNPTEELLLVVKEYLNNDKIRPLTDFVIVKSPERVDFEVIAELTLYTFADLETVLKVSNEKIEQYKISLCTKLDKDVVATQIITLLNSVYGVSKVNLKMPNDINIKANQWANLVHYEIKVVGYVNG